MEGIISIMAILGLSLHSIITIVDSTTSGGLKHSRMRIRIHPGNTL